MKVPPIRCAVCRREVEQTHITDTPEAGGLRVRVVCHGATQVETIDFRRYPSPPWEIVAAIAFVGASAPFTRETFR